MKVQQHARTEEFTYSSSRNLMRKHHLLALNIKLFSVILALFLLQGCSVPRVNTTKIAPSSEIPALSFPIDATLMVYVPPSEAKETITVRHGGSEKYTHTPGIDLKNASLAIAKQYFSNTSNLDISKKTHYILKLKGRADLDLTWGAYKVEVIGTLIDSSGNTVHETIAHASELSMLIIDKNAYYNAYAKAMKEILDLTFKKKGDEITSYIKTTPPSHLADNFTQNNKLLSLVSTGSGFLVNPEGQVITNQHVVEECLAVSVSLQGNEVPAKIKYVNKDLDIAVLDTELSQTNHITFSFDQNQPRLGEDILTIGFPLHGMLSSDPSLTTGNISALSGPMNNSNLIQITAPVQQGNSGGPVLNKQGNLTGVVQSKLNALKLAQFTGDIPQNVNFAIKAKKLAEVLDEAGIHYETSSRQNRTTISTPDIADEAIKYTVQIMCRG
jgi:serine protease Do